MDFARDAEASAHVLVEDLDMICIQTEATNGSMVQDKDMEQEHGKVWGNIRTAAELDHKRAKESTATNL